MHLPDKSWSRHSSYILISSLSAAEAAVDLIMVLFLLFIFEQFNNPSFKISAPQHGGIQSGKFAVI